MTRLLLEVSEPGQLSVAADRVATVAQMLSEASAAVVLHVNGTARRQIGATGAPWGREVAEPFRRADHTIWEQAGPAVISDMTAETDVAGSLLPFLGTPARSLLAAPLRLAERFAGALILMSDRPGHFTAAVQQLMGLYTAYATVALDAVAQYERAENLNAALESNRTIGTAIGVLMVNEKVTRDAAFDLLRLASQRRNVKIQAIADQVILTGALDLETA